MIAAVADARYTAVTVADIVQGARVSRSVFYTHFADKEDCFLSATRAGGRLNVRPHGVATRVVPPDASDEQVLRAGLLAFLEFLADERAFARVLYVDLPTAAPIVAERLAEASHRFANLNGKWHGRARTRHPEWPSVPGQAYEAPSGASSELVRPVVRAGQAGQAGTLVNLEWTLMSLHMAVLAARPWTA